jgi:hypothetical protein
MGSGRYVHVHACNIAGTVLVNEALAAVASESNISVSPKLSVSSGSRGGQMDRPNDLSSRAVVGSPIVVLWKICKSVIGDQGHVLVGVETVG